MKKFFVPGKLPPFNVLSIYHPNKSKNILQSVQKQLSITYDCMFVAIVRLLSFQKLNNSSKTLFTTHYIFGCCMLQNCF